MDYKKILRLAEEKLREENLFVISDLKKRIASGSTGGEISSIVGHYLMELKVKTPKAYFIIENEIKEYLLNCKKNGLYID